jgi:HEAT repeat protein
VCLNPHLCLSFIPFLDENDERILPAIIQSFSKCPDERLGNHITLLQIWGGKESKDALKDRFEKLKDNPQIFAKHKDWNELAFAVQDLCLAILALEPDNIEVVEYLAKLLKHPNLFNQEIAISRVSVICKNQVVSIRTRSILDTTLKSLSKTNNIRLFGMLMPYMFQVNPEKTYEKFKKLYLKTKKEDRYNFAVHLMYSLIDNSMFWICKLIRELPEEDTECFREYLNWSQVKPMSREDVVFSIKTDFASESPNTRIKALNRLKYISNEDAQEILEGALIDEPDEFIRKQFEKHLKKLKKV